MTGYRGLDKWIHGDPDAALEAQSGFPKDWDIDPTKRGFFRHHRCWKCNDGELPCVQGGSLCEYPRARND